MGRHYANIQIRGITLVIFVDPEDGSQPRCVKNLTNKIYFIHLLFHKDEKSTSFIQAKTFLKAHSDMIILPKRAYPLMKI